MAVIYKSDGRTGDTNCVAIGFDQHAGRWWSGSSPTEAAATTNMAPVDWLDSSLDWTEAVDSLAGPEARRVGGKRVEIRTCRDGDQQDVAQYI